MIRHGIREGVYDCAFLHGRVITSMFQEENHWKGDRELWCLYWKSKNITENPQHVSEYDSLVRTMLYATPHCKKRCEMCVCFFFKLGIQLCKSKLKALLRRKQKRMVIK